MELPAAESLVHDLDAFFSRDPREVAPDLLGMVIVSTAGGVLTGGRIVETEAYLGSDDPGSHASTKGITPRNATMYGPPGTLYVYFTYGNHHMLNLVCCPEGVAGGVLLRAIEPLFGVDAMRVRRRDLPDRELANGPGKLAQALGVDLTDNGTLIGAGRILVYHGTRPCSDRIRVSARVGLSSGHDLDYRYFIADDPFVSLARPGVRSVPRRRSTADLGESID